MYNNHLREPSRRSNLEARVRALIRASYLGWAVGPLPLAPESPTQQELRHVCHRLWAGLWPGLGPGHTRAAAERALRRSVDKAGPSVLLPLLVSLLSLSSLSLPLSPSLPRSFSRVCLCAGLVEPSVLPPSRLSLARSDSLSLYLSLLLGRTRLVHLWKPRT